MTGDRIDDFTGDVELAVLELEGRFGEPSDMEGIEITVLSRFGGLISLPTSPIAARFGDEVLMEKTEGAGICEGGDKGWSGSIV